MHSFILSIFRNNGKHNINFVNISIILILLLSTFFLFFNYKHTYSYGDQAVENIVATSQLDKLIRSDTDVDYSKFVRNNSKKIHGDKSNKENYNKYFIDPMIQGVAGDSLLVKALPYLLHLLIHNLFFFDNYSHSYFYLTIFIFLFTFFSILNFCNSLKIETLKIPLIIGFLSNIYIMQLHRGGLENHILFFIPLYFYSLSFLVKLFSESKINRLSYILYSFIFSLSFLNGYPNTSTILPFFLMLTALTLFFLNKNLKIYFKKIVIIFLCIGLANIFYFFESIIWSLILNKNIFYHISVLPDRTITMFKFLLGGNSIDNGFVFIDFINGKKDIIQRFFKNIFMTPHLFHAPHEPGMLLGINFFTYFERIFFIFGLVAIFFYRNNKLLFLVNLSILLSLFFRVFTHDNYQINKASFDYYSLCIYISYYGVYAFIDLIKNNSIKIKFIEFFLIKLSSTYQTIIWSFKYKKYILYKNNYYQGQVLKKQFLIIFIVILFFSFLHNLYRFNSFFIKDSDESLRELSALEPFRNFMKENHENNIFIFQQQHGYTASIDRILMLEEGINYDVLSNYENIDIDNYEKVYLVMFENNQVGPLREFFIGNDFFGGSDIDRFSYIETFSSSSGHPGIFLYEVKNNIEIFKTKNTTEKIEYELDTNTYSLNKIITKNFNGSIILSCENDIYPISTSEVGHNVYSLDFNKKKYNGMYYFENIFSNFNPKYKKRLNIITSNNEEDLKQHKQIYQNNIFVSDRNLLDMTTTYSFKETIEKFYIKFSYIFFNDNQRKNKLSVKYFDKSFNKLSMIDINSNGKEFYGRYTNFNNTTEMKQNKSYSKNIKSKILNFQFKLKNDGNENTSFLSSKNDRLSKIDTDSLKVNFTDKELFNFTNECQGNLHLSFDNKEDINNEVRIYVKKK
jgi:hypothetical protein